MLTAETILIVEDNIYLALDLCAAVEEMNGRVAGPACSVASAMTILESEPVSAAILDCQLPDGDVTPVARSLVRMGIPYLIQTGTTVPAALILLRSDAPVVMKPVNPKRVVAVLADHARNRSSSACPVPPAGAIRSKDAFVARENLREFEPAGCPPQVQPSLKQLHLRHLLAASEPRS